MLHTDGNPEDEPVTDPSLLRVMARLERNDIQTTRIKRQLANYRRPHWNSSLFKYPTITSNQRGTNTAAAGTDTVVYIPLSPPRQNEVQAYIKAQLNDSISLSLHFATQYKNYAYQDSSTTQTITAEKVAMRYMDLNEAVYGYTRFRILDSSLFRKLNANRAKIGLVTRNPRNPALRYEYVTNCYHIYITVEHCTTPDSDACSNGCDGCEGYCATYLDGGVVCETVLEQQGGGGSSGGTIGGGTTGGTGTGGGGGGGNGADPNTPPPGTIGWTPEQPTNPHQPPQDPCEKAKAEAERLDSIWQNSQIDSALRTISPSDMNRYEWAFNIIEKRDYNPNGPPYYINPRIITGMVVTQFSRDSVSPPSDAVDNITGVSTVWLGFTHTHADSTVAAPSAKDVYNVYKTYLYDRRRAIGNFIRANNGSTYVLKVSDPVKAAQFYNGMRDNLDTATRRYKDGTELGNIFDQAENYFLEKYKGQVNQAGKAFDMATAAVLSTQDSGITLFRQNTSGKFEPLILKLSPDPRSPSQVIFTNGCN